LNEIGFTIIYPRRRLKPTLPETFWSSVCLTAPSLQLGIQNVFDELPNAVTAGATTRTGNIPTSSQYDFIGRRGFVSVSRSW
jgi:hypothetical protein